MGRPYRQGVCRLNLHAPGGQAGQQVAVHAAGRVKASAVQDTEQTAHQLALLGQDCAAASTTTC